MTLINQYRLKRENQWEVVESWNIIKFTTFQAQRIKVPLKMRNDRNELSLDGFMINHVCLFLCDL